MNCAKNVFVAYRNKLALDVSLSVVFLIFGFYADSQISKGNISSTIIIACAFVGLPWGWNILSKITSKVFLFLPIIGWGIYSACKIALAFFINFFTVPYKMLKEYIRLNNLSYQIKTIS